MFVGAFVRALKMLLYAENAHVACFLNLSETNTMKFETASAIYLDQTTTETSFETKLLGDGPSNGWIYAMNRYGCTSDVGKWCIYCERANEIAVIALQSASDLATFERALAILNAGFLESLSGPGKNGIFPFNELTREWHDGLTGNFR
jgi:hypothetical protein